MPNGSIPVKGTDHFNSQLVKFEAYETKTQKMHFYFPENGDFQHYPSNITDTDAVIARSNIKTLKVSLKKEKLVEGTFYKEIS